MKFRSSMAQRAVSVICAGLLVIFSSGAPLAAQPQQPGPPPEAQAPNQPPAQLLSPDQLANLVAPIALYPDALLSQILVASTYPLEVVEAGQWLQQNRNLQGPQLVDAARQQNWDPSIQALVVFPDVIGRLNSDIRWTTDLGNAFLAQQPDVMNAVQRLRAQARAAGKLNSNSQQTVTTQTQGGQTAIDIQPANPEVVYVPTYNPEYIWGPPVYGYYPPLFYPGFGIGFGFGPGIFIGGFFGGLGWGGWGWGPNWFGGSIFVNGFFFNHFGYRGFGGVGFGGRGVWAHNPDHRLGVAYSNRAVANRFGGGVAGRSAAAGRVGGGNAGFANRGNFGAGAAARGSQFGAGRSSAPSSAARAGGWSHFGSSSAQSNARSGSAYGGGSAYRGASRATSSYGGANSGARSTSAYRSGPSSGGGFRSAPSGGGGGSHGGGASSSHGGGGGGSHGGGGGSHGGGSHGGGRR
jgi:hypothetical protein